LEKQCQDLARKGKRLPKDVLKGLASLSESLEHLKSSFEAQEQESERLYAVASVGQIVNSSLDLTTVLNEVMDTIIALTGAERGFLMLCNEDGQLEYRTARKMNREELDPDESRVSTTIANRVSLSAKAILTTNAQEDPRFGRQDSVLIHNLRSILCVPLKVKGAVTGVVYADNRARDNAFTQQDLGIVTAFANQAAVAIDNASLFAESQRAYDVTLEGWGRALELRDRETQGHTRRVTSLTMRLAKALGIRGDDLDDIRRGAVLHDIGKMGIPDHILLKPGPLTEQERAIMERHPVLAYEMLHPIEKLQTALDIPHRHHEKWDGTGYPDGLQGQEIPLAARIFAVADVWDALCSGRPYHDPWPAYEARIYIQDQAGKHFDPQVVQTFLQLDVD
jgi:putative nucleotidyltransferase with HDIG domain